MGSEKKFNPKKRGTFLHPEKINSAAYREISRYPTAHKLLLEFYRRVQTIKDRVSKPGKRKNQYIPINERRIIYIYRDMLKDTEVKSRSTITRNLDRLINAGFIDIVKKGQGRKREATVYGISDRWKKYGTKDFIHKPRPKDTRLGAELKDYQNDRRKNPVKKNPKKELRQLNREISITAKSAIRELNLMGTLKWIKIIGPNGKIEDTIKIPNRIIKRRQRKKEW
jgi:DNA-binding PadR family transcriptional regulator